jgi:hypothetical protein
MRIAPLIVLLIAVFSPATEPVKLFVLGFCFILIKEDKW